MPIIYLCFDIPVTIQIYSLSSFGSTFYPVKFSEWFHHILFSQAKYCHLFEILDFIYNMEPVTMLYGAYLLIAFRDCHMFPIPVAVAITEISSSLTWTMLSVS